ncbi:ribosome biogenesis GTP-binding protein YsxC [Candidatus Mycoplasma haematobovis]|uniref:Ribosome biogenesis GTP-binding protein YsxC n=1 Tax=Candidatus Mycoplasma haematobovis TaxID=432608 RepID=A0A1A9QD33_9MOLU|nr:ribosome biogenesis GTP-binding protein YihA/YsxC [Candidatus Mycoplasma haematobovis]OAL09876.1 ribosome biogenesis GTP-binding protein YsxC [Candidatus Mycoplasma haematobovis]
MARFITSAINPKHYPPSNLPEFSLAGASNAGKSTLINALAKEKIAKTSKQQGKTRTINFYDFNSFYLTDTPGYGYDKHSKEDKLLKIINDYLIERPNLIGVLHLCSPHGLSEQDLEIKNYLSTRFDNYLLLLNKVDKLSNAQREKIKADVLKATNLPEDKLLLVSGKKGVNVLQLLKKIKSWI